MAKELKPATPQEPTSNFERYASQFSEVISEFSTAYKRSAKEESVEEADAIQVFCLALESAGKSVQKEFMMVRGELDEDSLSIIDRHIGDSGILEVQRSTVQLLKKKRKGEKIALILELIKKVGLQIIEFIENNFNLPRILKTILNIIVALFEIIENVLPIILELFGINADFMKKAESNLLEFNQKWRKYREENIGRSIPEPS